MRDKKMDAIASPLIMADSQSRPATFEEIYREYGDYVYTVAYGVALHHDDAREIAQETFLKVYKNLSNFRHDSSIKTWLYRITVNESLNYVKKHRNKHKVDMDLEKVGSELSEPAGAIEAAGAHSDTMALLSQLKPDYRACMVLRNIQGLSYQEISQALGKNINTVRTWLRRGREQLLQHIKEGEGK
jgi:RNA polymerase sigma-70 factor (ECF subfamily)